MPTPDRPRPNANTSSPSIPTIDLARWRAGDTARAEVARAMGNACRTYGFAYLVHHGLDGERRSRCFEAARRFFALGDAAKIQLHFAKSGGHRGYIPLRGESTDPTGHPDDKEAFDVGLRIADVPVENRGAARASSPNLWPDELPGFREVVEDYFDAARRLAVTLFEMFAVHFGLCANHFASTLDRPIAQLRLLHYPARATDVNGGALGIGAHSDYECITLLAQDQVGGLEIEHEGHWLTVPPRDEALVVNVGEMLARWTNDRFVAARHRVVNPSGRERYAIPFFFGPNYETSIRCLEPCVDASRPARYAPTTAGDYLARRLEDTYGV